MWIADNWKEYEVIDCSMEKNSNAGEGTFSFADPQGHLGYSENPKGMET